MTSTLPITSTTTSTPKQTESENAPVETPMMLLIVFSCREVSRVFTTRFEVY